MEYQLNVIWPVDPFTADNGATRLWPGSHRDDAVDPFAIAPIAAEMAPGSALLFLGSILHGAGANMSGAVRRAVIVGYRSEEHTSELQSLMRISSAVFCLKKKTLNHH